MTDIHDDTGETADATSTSGADVTADAAAVSAVTSGAARDEVDMAAASAELMAIDDGMVSLALSQGSDTGFALPQPYASTIVLIDRTYLVGGRGFDGSGADTVMLDGIRKAGKDARLVLRRQPDDATDPWTVAVLLSDTSMGFIRAHENEIIARLMDAGKHVYAQYLETETLGDYHRIWVRVMMDD